MSNFLLGGIAITKLIVDEEFWNIFPDAQIFSLVVEGIDNQASFNLKLDEHMLQEAEQKAGSFLEESEFKNNAIIAEWRNVFSNFTKKKGARSSIEALLKRVAQDKKLAPINPLVDIYNSISLEYGVPCGGEDLDTIVNLMHLGLAKGNENFYPLGATKNDPPRQGEIIYYDEQGAICRSLNWRDGERTMLTTETTNAILIIEGITEPQKSRAQAAIKALQARIYAKLGVEGSIEIFANN